MADGWIPRITGAGCGQAAEGHPSVSLKHVIWERFVKNRVKDRIDYDNDNDMIKNLDNLRILSKFLNSEQNWDSSIE